MSENIKGRTFFDLIAEHPKYSLCFASLLVMILLIVIGALTLSGYGIKSGDWELKPPQNSTIHDTVRITDTLNLARQAPVNSKKKEKPLNPSNQQRVDNTVTSSDSSSVSFKNTVYGNNSGVVGDNAQVTVIGAPQRKVDDQLKKDLVYTINKLMIEHGLPENPYIGVYYDAGVEPKRFAKGIIESLKLEGYSNVSMGSTVPIDACCPLSMTHYRGGIKLVVGHED